MLRGFVGYKCKKCGHKFVGPDIELNATVDSMPVICPKCGNPNCTQDVWETTKMILKDLFGK